MWFWLTFILGIDAVLRIEAVKYILRNFQPRNEDQLIGFAKWLKSNEDYWVIENRWTLGDRIIGNGETV